MRKGFKLVFKGKAEVIEEFDNPIIGVDKKFKRPCVIRLFNYVNFPFLKVKLNRVNILKRDEKKCVYCGSKDRLTIDHVIPKSKGGGNTWENLVTCCFKCNFKKDNKTYKEVGFTMSHKPYRPTYFDYIHKSYRIETKWRKYLGYIK